LENKDWSWAKFILILLQKQLIVLHQKLLFCDSPTADTGTATMSSAGNDGYPYPDAVLLDSVKDIIEGEISEDDIRESSHLSQVPTSALSSVSSTLASMTTLQNIDVSKSASHAILPSISCMKNSVHSCSRSSIKPYESYNWSHAAKPGIESVELRHKKAKFQTIPSNNKILRRGKWTQEEEEYANAVMREFNSGFLDAQAGTTLRIYLSEKLQCDPMRITKKFTGNDSIGKRVFHPNGRIGDGLCKEARDAQVRHFVSIVATCYFTAGNLVHRVILLYLCPEQS